MSDMERIQQLMGRVIDGEATDLERAELDTHLEKNPSDRAVMDEMTKVGSLFRAEIVAELDSVDLSGIWSGVSAELDRAKALVPVQDVSVWDQFSAWLNRVLPVPAPALGWASAAVAIVLVAVIGPRIGNNPGTARGLVSVEQVDAAANMTVMLYKTPDDNVMFIWLFEDDEEPS